MAPGSLSGLPSGLRLLPPVGLLGVVYPPAVGKPGGGGVGGLGPPAALCAGGPRIPPEMYLLPEVGPPLGGGGGGGGVGTVGEPA
eukprot:795788-Amphidinium_carterae.1